MVRLFGTSGAKCCRLSDPESQTRPDYAKDAKFIVSEYDVEGLRNTGGVQLFRLDCGPGSRVELFAYAN